MCLLNYWRMYLILQLWPSFTLHNSTLLVPASKEGKYSLYEKRNTQRHEMVKENQMEGLLSYTITSEQHLI